MGEIREYVFSRLAKEVKVVEEKAGRKVLNFGPGTPDVPPSTTYIRGLQRFIKERGSHLYPGYSAIPEFADALTTWYKNRFGVNLIPIELLPLLGGKDGITHLPLALLNEGDEVLIPDPGYPAYTIPATMVGAKVITYDLLARNDFKLDFEELERKITPKTKLMWVNFPSNPTGQVATLDELTQIVNFTKRHKIFILYDNAYSEITFNGYRAPSILQVPEARKLAIEIGSFSKSFSFAGYRMGWIVGNHEVVAALAKVKTQMDSGMSLPLQRLGAYALTNYDEKWHKKMISSYERRREAISKHLTSLGLTFSLPKGSLYIWAKIPSSSKNSEEFCKKLLYERQILLTPGTAFGKNGEKYVRISICINIDKIDEYFNEKN